MDQHHAAGLIRISLPAMAIIEAAENALPSIFTVTLPLCSISAVWIPTAANTSPPGNRSDNNVFTLVFLQFSLKLVWRGIGFALTTHRSRPNCHQLFLRIFGADGAVTVS